MSEYPREDKPLAVSLSDNTLISGLVNIAGRTTQEVLEDEGPDLVLYDAQDGDGMPLKTVFIGKDRILWIAPDGEAVKPEAGSLLKQVKFRLAGGQVLTGKVEISGFDRLSDYFHARRERFYKVMEASLMDRTYDVLYLGIQQVLWKQPVD